MSHGRHRAPTAARWRLGVAAGLTAVGGAAAVPTVALWQGAAEVPAPAAAAPAPTQEASPAPSSAAATPSAIEPVRRSGPAAPGLPAGTPVMLLGDSLAVGIADQLAESLPRRVVTVDAEEGRRTTTAAALLSDQAAGSARIWVVSLGTNDSPEEFGAAAGTVMELAGPHRCVLWYDVWRPSTHDELNLLLGDLADEFGNLHVLAWHAAAEANPQWFSDEDVHPSTDGYRARSDLATAAVADSCTSPG